ncbi:tyrosine-type recombinase/integrase [Rhizobium sp. SU303]|uniref:tyrosine-type recombinase/integrase n=1 Tax=Rhizobium sp. SU303 TaxID=3138065 RepID=UPI001E37FCE4|nr:tyrosine-type recombinase/integrase [Rhizobium leguminosarum]UFW79973.1 site-specific integrase [Rhizobium leguminosarum bv. viciae]
MNDVANIDLPYVEKNKSRHGTVRYYLRIDGKRVCRLPEDIDSEEFSKAYWKARNAALPAADGEPTGARTISSIVKPNTFRWLCMEYMRSDAFKALDTSTQTARRKIMEAMWLEPVKPGGKLQFGDMPLPHMDHNNIEVLRDRKKETPFAADERLKVLRQVFDTKKDGKHIVPNVARLVDPFAIHTDGHATATPQDLAQYIEHHGIRSKAVLCVAILMFTGFRVSDASQLGPQHRRKDMFKLRLFKNRNRKPYDIEIAIHPILESVLAMHKVTALTYLVTEFGKAFSIKGLGNRISDWFRQAGLPHLTAHSVRKGLATDVAHNEATDSMLEAMFGWRDAKTSKIYTRNADRARLARQTVARINWDGVGTKLLAIIEESDVANG